MTPIFSFFLSRLTLEVSIGAQNTSTINLYGGIVLAIAALDGLLLGLKYFIMETTAMYWVTRVRNICYKLVLSQDKKWFDKSDNSSVRLVQILIKDGDDARALIATVLAQCFVVFSMFSVGLIWALVQGWQLTLVEFAIAPVFASLLHTAFIRTFNCWKSLVVFTVTIVTTHGFQYVYCYYLSRLTKSDIF
jgi:ATP-binding cassette, subfamily B (MDR/TAP), member 1